MSITEAHPTSKITRRWKLKTAAAVSARSDGATRSHSSSDRGPVFDKSANPGDGLGWPLLRRGA